jgi:hypothetical protein
MDQNRDIYLLGLEGWSSKIGACCLRFKNGVATTHAKLASGWLAGLPLPGGSRTLWIALKGFGSHFHSPFLDLSWRYRNKLPPFYHSITSSAVARSVSRARLPAREHNAPRMLPTHCSASPLWPAPPLPAAEPKARHPRRSRPSCSLPGTPRWQRLLSLRRHLPPSGAPRPGPLA